MIGVVRHDLIKAVLVSPWVVSVMPILGGVVLTAVERFRPAVKVDNIDKVFVPLALRIGLCQTVAKIPGVSRSGATIVGAVLLGMDRRAATEFSFFLAITTMLGATIYDLSANWSLLRNGDALLLAVGPLSAFVAGMFVIRRLIGSVSRNGFVPFGWYRIATGAGMLVLLVVR